MKHFGLLGVLLVLLIQVATSENLLNDGGDSPDITVNVELENSKNVSEENPRWVFGGENQQVNRQNDFPGSSSESDDSSSPSDSDSSESSDERSSRTSEESEEPTTTTEASTEESEDSSSDSSRGSSDSNSDTSPNSDSSSSSDRSSNPDRSSNSDRSSISDRSSNQDRSSNSDRSSNPDRSSNSDRSSDPDRSSNSDRSSNPDRSSNSDRSYDSDRSSNSDRSSDPERSSNSDRSSDPERSSNSASSSSSSSEESSESTGLTAVAPDSSSEESYESSSSSSSSEESEESSETCVGHKTSKWNELWGSDGSSLENSRKPKKRCDDHHKKRCPCSQHPYRNLNGTCNNLKFPKSGAVDASLRRLVAARYCDGKSTERRSATDGRPLPSSRVITNRVFGTKRIEDKSITHLAAIFWVFVAEDIFFGKQRGGKDSHQCCTSGGKMIPKKDLPDTCLPIKIPKNDPFFSKFHQRCLPYKRIETAANCKEEKHLIHLGAREIHPIQQLNSKTSYLDLSPVYGTCEEESNKLREHKNGLLKTKLVKRGHHSREYRTFLPNVEDAREVCGAKRKDEVCYLSGNSQVNSVVALAALQTLFVRYHNSIAMRLHEEHPSWDDEALFQQSRKIMIGIYQNIVYNEWISTLLGMETLEQLKLPFNELKATYYDHEVDAGAINDMASAGLSMSSTLLSSLLSLMDEERDTRKKINLISVLNDPSILEQHHNFDSIIRGLATQPAEAFDGNFTKVFLNLEIINNQGKVSGLDLVATDVQSGRDLGISTYNDARQLCGLERAEDFKDFDDTLKIKEIEDLQHVYSSANDVDLLVGLLVEKPYDDGVLGRVGTCLFGEQFLRLRKGDRFFANVDGYKHSFTEDQLKAILDVKMSSLLCRGSDDVENMQLKAFRQISSENELEECSKIPKLDLKPWDEMDLPTSSC